MRRIILNSEDIIYRDKVLRAYLTNRNWDEESILGSNPEFQLMRRIVKNQFNEIILDGFLKTYPYIYDFEYETRLGFKKGKGDLLFSDLKGNFLVVECKSLKFKRSSTKRTAGRKDLKTQLPKYVKFIKNKLRDVKSVVGLGFTDMETPFKLFCDSYYQDSAIIPDFKVEHIIPK